MVEKNGTAKFSLRIVLAIVLAGAIVTFSMYTLIQNSFYKATVNHEMELMLIMEKLGSQLIDTRLKGLKTGLEDKATQYRKELVLGGQEEIEQALFSISEKEGGVNYSYQTREERYEYGQFREEDILEIELTEAWGGESRIIRSGF